MISVVRNFFQFLNFFAKKRIYHLPTKTTFPLLKAQETRSTTNHAASSVPSSSSSTASPGMFPFTFSCSTLFIPSMLSANHFVFWLFINRWSPIGRRFVKSFRPRASQKGLFAFLKYSIAYFHLSFQFIRVQSINALPWIPFQLQCWGKAFASLLT